MEKCTTNLVTLWWFQDFLVLVLTPRIWGEGSVLSLRVSFRFLSVLYHVFSAVWLQPDSFHEEYDSLGNLWHTSGCALDFFFSCLGRGTGWMWRYFGSLGFCFCVTVWFCLTSVHVRKGSCILEFVPSLSLSLHINWSHKRCHLSLRDLPFLYPWAVVDTGVIVGICWICNYCEPSLYVFFHRELEFNVVLEMTMR